MLFIVNSLSFYYQNDTHLTVLLLFLHSRLNEYDFIYIIYVNANNRNLVTMES